MGFDWGMGVLPYFKQPTTIICGAPLGIFTSSKHPEEAFQLFKALGDTASNDLFGNGLWMPLYIEDYTDPARISQWLNSKPGVYPAEARSVLVDYIINHTPRQYPMYWLRKMHSEPWIKRSKKVKNCCKVGYLKNKFTFAKPTLM